MISVNEEEVKCSLRKVFFPMLLQGAIQNILKYLVL